MSTKKGTNKNDRLVGGNGDDVLYGLGGNDTLDGGKGDDDIMGGDGNDRIIGRADGSDAIDGGKGTDTLDYSKVTTGLYIQGAGEDQGYIRKGNIYEIYSSVEIFLMTKKEDTFVGDQDHDLQIFGGGGADAIFAGGSVMRGDAGQDILVGTAGSTETFWLQRGKGADIVTAYSSQEDVIWLDGDEFALGAKVSLNEFATTTPQGATGSKPQLVFDSANKMLYYDPDGAGSKAAELIASFTNIDGSLSVFSFEIV